VATFRGLKQFKMAAVAMVTKVQEMLNSLQTSQIFAVIFLKNQPLKAQLHMAYDIPTKFHKV
jgi:hypothetical protein